jgi:hypothetical protein
MEPVKTKAEAAGRIRGVFLLQYGEVFLFSTAT